MCYHQHDTIALVKRTSILLDPGLLAELERLARSEGVPTSQVIRRALQSYVAAQQPEVRRLPGFIGIATGPGGDVAERAEEILAGAADRPDVRPDEERDSP